MQQKTQRPVQFEITEQTRESLTAWIRRANVRRDEFLFPSRLHGSPHLSTRQYARIVHRWVKEIGLDPAASGTHTLRRIKASFICKRTKNLRAVQLLLAPDTTRSNEPYGTWESRLTTRSKWRSKRRYSPDAGQRLFQVAGRRSAANY